MAGKTKSLEMAPRKAPEASSPSRTPAPSVSPSGFGLATIQGAAGNMAIQRAAREEGGEEAPVRSEGALNFLSVGAAAERITVNPAWSQLATCIHPKLAIGATDDPYEREADGIADLVMRMPDRGSMDDRPSWSPVGAATAQRKCAACKEEEERVRRKPAGSATGSGSVAPPVVHQALGAPGQPLDPATHAFFEPRFGVDFDRVRVHTDTRAAEAADAIDARAFTFGNAMLFAAGEYSPRSAEGKRLIAHELAHVAQQSAAPARVWRDRRTPPKNPDQPKGSTKFSTGTPVTTGQHTSKPNLDIEYTLETVPGVGPDQRPKSAALLKYDRKVWIVTARGDEAVLRIHSHSDLNPPFDPKQTNFKHLKAPGFSNFYWVVEIKYSKATGDSLNFWHTPDDGVARGHIRAEDQSLPDLAEQQAPPFAKFYLSEDAQFKAFEEYIERKAAEEVPEYKRRLEEERRRIEEWRKKHPPRPAKPPKREPPEQKSTGPSVPEEKEKKTESDPDTVTEEDFENLSPDARRDLAWRALKDEISGSNIGKGVLLTLGFGLLALGAILAALFGLEILATVLVAAVVVAAVAGIVYILKDTISEIIDRIRHSEWAEAALTLLKGLAIVGAIIAGALLVIGAVFGAIVSTPFLIGAAIVLGVVALGIGIYLAYRDYEWAAEAKNLTDFRRSIDKAARGVEGAIVDGVGTIISALIGRATKWVTGQPKAPVDMPEPAPKTQPPATPEPPATPKPAPEPEPAPKTPQPAEHEPPPKPSQEPAKPDKPKRATKAKPVGDDPQQGVRDALEQTKQKIADADAEIATHAKELSDAGENLRTLYEKRLAARRGDPGFEQLKEDLRAAQERVKELKERQEHRISENDKSRATRDRLQNALDAKTYDHPGFTPAERAEVWRNAQDADGRVFSPSGKEIKPGAPWDVGHQPKYENWKHVESAARRAITRDQFIRECKELIEYRPETPADNRSRLYEDKTDAYLGP